MTEEVQHLAQRLEQEGDKSLEFFRSLPEIGLGGAGLFDGVWLAHS